MSRPLSRSAASSPSATASPCGSSKSAAASSACANVWPRLSQRRGAAVVRVAQAERRLVRGGAAHVERPAGEQLGLDAARPPLAPLALGQRREQRLVDHDAHRPVERADEVLALRDVDRRLAADPGVDLADERRRHGDPRDAAEVGRGGEGREVGRRAAAERDDRAAAVERQLRPEPLDDGELLRGLARRAARASRRAGRRAPPSRRAPWMPITVESATSATGPSPGTSSPSRSSAAGLVVDAGRCEHDAVEVAARDGRVGDLAVERLAAPRRAAGTPPRPARAAGRSPRDALPRRLDVDVEQDRERARSRASSRTDGVLTAPPPRSSTDGLASRRASRTSASPRRSGTPSRPASRRTPRARAAPASSTRSTSTTGRPSARARPPAASVVLPAPMKPISARCRSSAFRPSPFDALE